MNDEKLTEEMINDEIDGFNTPSQSTRLRERLSDNPESQALFEKLQTLSRTLRKVKEVEPPESLKHTIMNSIPRYKYAAEKSGKSKTHVISQLVRSFFAPRYALTFATGTAAGLLLFAVFSGSFENSSVNPLDITGSIGGSGDPVSIAQADHAEFAFQEVSGNVATSTSGSTIWTQIELSGSGEVTVALSFSSEQLLLSEASIVAYSPMMLKSTRENILLVLSGPGEHTIAFDRLANSVNPLKVRIDSEGEVFEKELSTVPK